MNNLELFTKAKDKLIEAYRLIPKNSSLNKNKKNPMRILSKVESLIIESKSLYEKVMKSGYDCKNMVDKCDEFLKDVGKYYSWLSSYYRQLADRYMYENSLLNKIYLKKSQKCFKNYKRLTEGDPVMERVRRRL